MNRLLDNDPDPPAARYTRRGLGDEPADREISLGTPTILGIFFALAVVCAGFFGFGYVLGRRSVDTAATIPTDVPAAALGSAAKPSAGLAGQPSAPAPPADVPASPATGPTATVPLTSTSEEKSAVTPADAMLVGDKSPAAQATVANSQPASSFVVQIAAVSSQDVADILLSSLEKKGYTVAVRHEPQDKLLHVQIGPFADRKDAEAMRQRVLADGFNAIVK